MVLWLKCLRVLLADENQLPQIKQRLAALQKQINLGIYKDDADKLASQIDDLYVSLSKNIRRLRLSLGGILSPDGFQLSGVNFADDVLSASDILSGSSAFVFDFGDFLSSNSPVGFMVSYKTSDGKQEQRDLLREFPSLRDRVIRMKARAEEFAKYSSQLGTMGISTN